jgi:integrase
MSAHPLISNAPLNLSYEELVELTHFKLASKQARALSLMGFTFILRLTMSDLKTDGIHIQRHKTAKTTGKRTIYQWTPELREAVDMALASRPALSPFLFCNKFGKGYVDESKGTAAGFKSMWQRFFERVIAETKVTEHFTEHDLRAKCASDAETLEHARALLSHADARTTDKIYRRKPEKIASLGMKKAS